MSNKLHRLQWIDTLRGFAIVLMIGFHFCYDLRYFGWVEWRVPNGEGWWQVRYFILSLFIFTVGLSLALAHANAIRWRKFFIRFSQLAAAAFLISFFSRYMFPESWIYFGILHFIAAASLISVLFVRIPFLAGLVGMGFILSHQLGMTDSKLFFSMIEEYLPKYTEDFVPFSPWLGVCLLGVAGAHYLPLQKIENKATQFNWLCKHTKWINFLGKHGLVVYLIHQPILFAILTPLSFWI